MDEHYRVGMDMWNGYHCMELEWTEWMNITGYMEQIYGMNVWNRYIWNEWYMEQVVYRTDIWSRYMEQLCGTDIWNSYVEQIYGTVMWNRDIYGTNIRNRDT